MNGVTQHGYQYIILNTEHKKAVHQLKDKKNIYLQSLEGKQLQLN